MPIPSFAGQPITSGVVSGILGGWFGFSAIAQLIALVPWASALKRAAEEADDEPSAGSEPPAVEARTKVG